MSNYTVKITNVEQRNNGTAIVDFDVNDGYSNVGMGSVECGTEGHYLHDNRRSYQFTMGGDVTEATILAAVQSALDS